MMDNQGGQRLGFESWVYLYSPECRVLPSKSKNMYEVTAKGTGKQPDYTTVSQRTANRAAETAPLLTLENTTHFVLYVTSTS